MIFVNMCRENISEDKPYNLIAVKKIEMGNFGAFAARDIPFNTHIGTYIGETIPSKMVLGEHLQECKKTEY
jgi:hypothetical protein